MGSCGCPSFGTFLPNIHPMVTPWAARGWDRADVPTWGCVGSAASWLGGFGVAPALLSPNPPGAVGITSAVSPAAWRWVAGGIFLKTVSRRDDGASSPLRRLRMACPCHPGLLLGPSQEKSLPLHSQVSSPATSSTLQPCTGL